MKKQTQLIAVFAFVLALGGSALANTPSQYIGDAAVTTKVKAALMADKDVSATKVNVETNDGTVHLTGNVSSKAEEKEVVHIVNTVDGVKAVNNKLNVRAD
ncbi:MAG: BON domain-containing protein [Alphaproteobacteria bacterium]